MSSEPATTTPPTEARDPLPDAQIGDRAEWLIAWTLRVGVLASLALVLSGMILGLLGGPGAGGHAQLHHLTGPHGPAPRTIPEAFAGALAGRSAGLVSAGVLILIATPVARVLASVVAFAWRRDKLYTAITAVVLALLTVSIVSGAK